MAASSAAAAAAAATTNPNPNPIPIPAEAISEECKDDDALTSTLHTCANDPDFAVICAFLQKFAKDLGLNLPNFKQLQEWLTNNNEVPELRDLHIKLLRKTRKTVHEKSWESALSKFCFGYSVQDAWEVERFGYKNSSLKVKLRIFRELLESQFERNAKFRSHILTLNADTLRSEPIGRDRLGHAYWLTQDADCNLRIYQEHLDEEIWQVVATNREEFVNLIARLRGNEVVLPSKDIGEADEDTSSSNSCPAKPPPPEEREEEDEEGEEDEEEPVKTVPNLKIKLRSPEQEEQKSKRVKPLLISQTKLGGSASPAPAKKRSIEDVDSSPTASQEEQQKKHRPTLLDTKRIKKPSRYESTKDENEGESGEEGGEEEEEEDEDDSDLDEGEEEEDIDSAAADIEEDDDEEEVGEAIEDPTIVVRGQGSGQDNETIPLNFMSDYLGNFDYEEDLQLSEAIEDPVLNVIGFGWGADCLVGNGNNGNNEAPVEETTAAATSEPKATFFFGEPGCLKLSPMKQTPKPETKRSIFDTLSEEQTNGEGEKCRESTPPRNGSALKETPADGEAAASSAANEEPKKIAEAEKTEISKEQIKDKEIEEVAERDMQEFKVNVIETNEKISKGITKTETLEKAVPSQKGELSVLQNHSDNVEQSSFKNKDLCEILETEDNVKKRLEEAGIKENGPTKIEDDKPSVADKQNSNKDIKTLSKCNDKPSSEAETPKTNQNNTRTKTEPETVTPAKEPTTSEVEIKPTTDPNKSKSIIEPPVEKIDDKSLVKESKVSPEKAKETVESEPESHPLDNKPSTSPEDKLKSSSEAITTCNETLKAENASPAENKLEEKVQKEGNEKSLKEGDVKNKTDAVPKPSSTLLNRKRRLNDAQPAFRNSTSESEVQEDEPQDEDPTTDDLDVGGKRIKMRPKTSNVEARRKVEAQKTQIEETTSSSGEEDPRSRRKIITPQTKQKPTLEEIIEKKLKKTTEKELPEAEEKEQAGEKITEKPQTAREATPPSSSFSPPKKSPITKPLKKNLLTQLRQEESEEEAIPRKRTNSETILPAVSVPSGPLAPPEERHRKRRSSEDAKECFSKESSPSEPPPSAVSEKLKRNNEQDIEEEVEDPIKDSSPLVKSQSPPPDNSARRSGRRGGAAVVHSELPQPKRTRGGGRDKIPTEVKAEEVKEESDDDDDEEVTNVTAKLKSENIKEDPVKETPSKETTPEKEDIKEKSKEEPKPKVGRGRGPRKKRDVDTTNIIETNDSETPVRQSRRIAQQKIKEEAERRKQEEVALRSMKQELKKKKKAEKEADPTVLEPSGEESESEASEAEEEARSKKKKKLPGKDGWSSDSEEQPESEEEEEEPPHYETDPGSPLFRSDHEFSPESELEDESQVVPMKRARTVRKENAEDQEEEDAEEACQKCGKSDHPEWILLCDTPACNKGYHCSCLSPVLFYIPEGDWHCPPCQQEQLIVALERQLLQFDTLVAQKQQERILAEERAELERQAATLAAKDESFKREKEEDDEDDDEKDDEAISKADKVKRRRGDGRSNRRAAKRGTRRRRGNDSDSSNGKSAGSGSKSGSGSGSGSSSSNSSSFSDSDDEPIYKLRKRRQINVSYRLNEYDDLINSALKKEMDEVAGAGNLGRGKDISTIIEADKEKARQEDDPPAEGEAPEKKIDAKEEPKTKTSGSSQSSSEDEIPLKRSNKFKQPPAKKKPRKLTTLDVSSEEDHGSDEDFKTSSYSDEDTSQSGSGDSDSSLEVYRRPGRGKKQRKAARRAARERRKDRKFVVEESDESEEEDQKRRATKPKKKKKEDSDYTETETEDDDNELSENVDSADLCDDTTSESEDGNWKPSSKKKKAAAAKKSSSSAGIARKSPKLKKPAAQSAKKVKRLEYSDDDISESDLGEEEDEDEEDGDGAPLSGKGSGKQPRSQPLKSSGSASQAGKGKGKGKAKKKKSVSSEEDEGAASDDRTRTRGRRYAYIEDDDDSSDGGIKPGVHRPDTPPEERQKFIQRQEEIKRMLAEKNAEGAKLAATPRLTPIKSGAPVPEKRTPGKAAGGDSLSTVPLSVIRQAKVLDIDYLQRKGETIGDLDDVDESELDDAELPDDLPEDMEDAIARMVEEEEQFSAAVAARELPGAEEVLRTTPSKAKQSAKATTEAPAAHPAPSASGLQEPHRKRLPMPTMHPPLLRHQFPSHPPASLLPPHSAHGMHPMLQRHLSQAVPPPQAMHLLQNALSAPLGQPLSCGNYGAGPGSSQHLPLVMSMPSAAAAAAAHLMQSAAAAPAVRPPETAAGNAATDSKPRGRRKKVTPLRDQLQKQQTAAAVTAATSSSTPGTVTPEKVKGQAALFKPHEDAAAASPATSQASVITRMPAHLPPPHGRSHGPPVPGGMYPSSAELARFYSQVAAGQQPGSRSPSASSSGPPRHLLRPQLPPGLPPPHASLRPTYGPPPPLRGSVPPTSTASVATPNSRPPYLHGAEHLGGPSGPPLGGVFSSGPPPARHASPHLNPYRAPPIYGNPNYSPRIGGPPGPGDMRPGSVDYAAGARGYSPYGYYPPPPPLTTPSAHATPSSVIVSAPPAGTPTNHSVSTLTHAKTLAPGPSTQSAGPPPAAAPPPAIPSEAAGHKAAVTTSVITSKKLTTLEAYPIRKSPIAVVGDVTGAAESTNSPAAIAEDDSGSAHDTRAPPSSTGAAAVGEFSGLVSYFSSQQDDYDT
ncbi:microtubule-associated protein futsch [Drosophila takahashii]|uniref:microtubule-associated protein futsch n=1 Tax=Drosophila takahashii TaxID=29030 RepID=UPI001CF889A4|nr:titin homolog [Drosophila takahashii]